MSRFLRFKVFFKKHQRYFTYGSILLGFIIWMFFLDTHSWKIHSELNKEMEQLEMQKEALQKLIEEDRMTIKNLENTDSLERFAREQYGHKKENETIFYIEYKDSIQQ